MQTLLHVVHARFPLQFGLLALMEFVTISAILFALSPAIGIATSIFLVLMALALTAKLGVLAIVMLAGALVAADSPFGASSNFGFAAHFVTFLISSGLCAWFCLRRHWSNSLG